MILHDLTNRKLKRRVNDIREHAKDIIAILEENLDALSTIRMKMLFWLVQKKQDTLRMVCCLVNSTYRTKECNDGKISLAHSFPQNIIWPISSKQVLELF